MRFRPFLPILMLFSCLIAFTPTMEAQNSIHLFGPVNVRVSPTDASYSNPYAFNSNTLNLTCPDSPVAVLSSSANTLPTSSTGNVLVDNEIVVTNLTTSNSPLNVCKGGVDSGTSTASCFTAGYQGPAGAGSLTGVDPDTLVATGGVSPIDISSQLVSGSQQLKIDLVDDGGYLTGSTVYLNTNCTPGGVSGPAQISGNPIPSEDPSPQQLKQDFTFNPVDNNLIDFEYDLTGAQNAGSLTIDSSGVIPQVGDSPISPVTFQTWAQYTPFATSSCLVHDGELLPNGQAACKLFTLECTTGTGSTATGAQCPISSLPNEQFKDIFDGPSFTLPDIPTPSGVTFHEGMGFLMASEGWAGGPCSFDPASGLQDVPCPQNLLVSFTGPGTFSSGGQTTRPNSTFISVAQVPEDLTTVSLQGEKQNHWINRSSATITFSSLPPNLTGTNLPGASQFVPSPIHSITYGISTVDNLPTPGVQIPTDVQLLNSADCPVPSPSNPGPSVASTFTPPAQTLTFPSDGHYLLHYYAQDCAGTEELKFTQDATKGWKTSFYTYPINVDTVAPSISDIVLTPAPSLQGTYTAGQVVTASYSCTDATSGVVRCGHDSFRPDGTLDTGTLTATANTSSTGTQTFTVTAKDAAGNQSSASVTYQVVK